MNNQDFDRIWQEAGAGGIVALSATTIPLLLPQRHDDYIAVCCNRAGTNDAQWVDLAADMLITEMI